MFTQSCFIRKDTQELRDKLKEIGLVPHPCIVPKACAYLFVNRGFYSRNKIGYQEEVERAIDCGENEELFLAIAALRDDTDVNQWFIVDVDVYVNLDKGEWFKATNIDGNYHVVIKLDPLYCHKATVEELIEHFGK